MIAASPVLLAREQRALARTAGALAAVLAADVRRLGQRAFALLEHGLGDHATGPPRPTHAPTATRTPRTTEAQGVQ